MPTWFEIVLWIGIPLMLLGVAAIIVPLFFLIREDARAQVQVDRAIRDAKAADDEEQRQLDLANERIWREPEFRDMVTPAGDRFTVSSTVYKPAVRDYWIDMETQLLNPERN